MDENYPFDLDKVTEKFVRQKNNFYQLYEDWRGSNYFYCNGTCVLGPLTFRPIVLTSLITIIPTALYIGYEYEVSYNAIKIIVRI